VWKDAYEALEAAQVLFLRKFGGPMRMRAGSPEAMLEMLIRLAGRLASQTRRSEESEHFQQSSTPLALGFVVAEAAALTPSDVVLEPSTGTGLLAIFADLAKARLALNEIAETRAGLLGPAVPRRHRHPPQRRADPRSVRSSAPPERRADEPAVFGSPKVEGRFAEAAIRHIGSALTRLAEGGPLVAITGHNIGPDQRAWREAFVRLQQKGRIVFTATIAGRAYVRRGTTIETRLTVIDRIPAEDPHAFPSSPGLCADPAELLDLVPPRPPVTGTAPPGSTRGLGPRAKGPPGQALPAPAVFPLRSALTTRSKAPVPTASPPPMTA